MASLDVSLNIFYKHDGDIKTSNLDYYDKYGPPLWVLIFYRKLKSDFSLDFDCKNVICFKKIFSEIWHRNGFDKLESQSVADLLMDNCINFGTEKTLSILNQCLSKMTIDPCVMLMDCIAHINDHAGVFLTQLKQHTIDTYRFIAQRETDLNCYLAKWIRKTNSF